MNGPMIASNTGVLMTLAAVAAFFFFLAHITKWKLFEFLPPLIFIYVTPVILSNTDVIPSSSPVYSWIRSTLLPVTLTLLLIKVDVRSAFKVMGRGVFVMLFGTLGVVIGAPIAFLVVKTGLSPEGWKAFGTLAGSWIGGTGNMAAVSEMIDTGSTEFGLAVIADNLVYIVWLPVMLMSKNLAGMFARFSGVSKDRLAMMEAAAEEIEEDEESPHLYHYLYLFTIALAVTWIADGIGGRLPELQPYISAGTWKILIVTTLGIGLSFTPARRLPGSFPLAMAFIYIFVARMGASADLGGLASQAPWFVLGAFIWIFIHGGFCLLGAKLFKVDVHTAAIASAANIGGAASAPIVAAYHNKKLVPVSILMALIGYAIGNYAGWLAAILCQMLS